MNDVDESLMKRNEERLLVEAIVNCDGRVSDALLEQLLSCCEQQITYFARSFKLNEDDILSELILRLCADNWRRLRDFQGQSQLSTWLSAIIRNLCKDFLRSKQRQRRVDFFEHGLEDKVVAEPDKDSDLTPLWLDYTKSDVREAFARLSEDDQLILYARYVDELSVREIAELLKITPNHAGVQLHRARERLGKILEQNDNG